MPHQRILRYIEPDRVHVRLDGLIVTSGGKEIDEEIVAMISMHKNEPEWMLEFRLNALKSFQEKPVPQWGGNLNELDFDDIYYYIRPMENQGRSWDDVPDDIKNTFDKLGIPQAERDILAGVGAQYESE